MILRDHIPFTKEQLVEIAQSLDIEKATKEYEKAILVDMIINSINEGATSYLEEFDDFMMHYYKDDFEVELESFEVPGCYTRPDDTDDKCGQCFLYQNCTEELMEHIPDCFGILHHEQKCSDCILKIKCGVNMERSGIDSQYEVVFLESIPLLSNLLNAFVKFRNIYQAWPKLLLISRKNRYFSVRKRGVTQRVNEQITSDSFVLSTDTGPLDNPSEQIPLILNVTRKPLIVEEYFAKSNYK